MRRILSSSEVLISESVFSSVGPDTALESLDLQVKSAST